MEILNVLVAALAAFAFGAVWYSTMANPWMAAAGIQRGADGKPISRVRWWYQRWVDPQQA